VTDRRTDGRTYTAADDAGNDAEDVLEHAANDPLIAREFSSFTGGADSATIFFTILNEFAAL